ncbi:hypothetical protein IID04_06935, partial [PVC group bacterium]|nr:hypothetical protein [PVC group bacterium]
MMTRWIPVVVRKSIRNKLALSIFLGVVIVLALISHYRFRQLYSRFQNHFETSSSLSTQLAIRETELWFTDNLK